MRNYSPAIGITGIEKTRGSGVPVLSCCLRDYLMKKTNYFQALSTNLPDQKRKKRKRVNSFIRRNLKQSEQDLCWPQLFSLVHILDLLDFLFSRLVPFSFLSGSPGHSTHPSPVCIWWHHPGPNSVSSSFQEEYQTWDTMRFLCLKRWSHSYLACSSFHWRDEVEKIANSCGVRKTFPTSASREWQENTLTGVSRWCWPWISLYNF